MGCVYRSEAAAETWRSRLRTPKGSGESEAYGRAVEGVSSRVETMMRPKFDDADLALLEIKYADNELVVDLVHEIRVYQDLLLAKQIEFDMARSDDDDSR
jgi:hypothetical protein